MLTEFGKILIFIMLAAIFVVVVFIISKLLSPDRPTKEKYLTYECGENPEGSPWVKFNIRFYVIALIFLIFDVEVVLLFPWALTYKEYGFYGLAVGLIFLLVLIRCVSQGIHQKGFVLLYNERLQKVLGSL